MDTNSADLAALIAEATVDANDDDEQLIGFHSVIEEYLAVPFEAEVLGVPVTVEQIELTDADHLALSASAMVGGRTSHWWTFRCQLPHRQARNGSPHTAAGQGGELTTRW